MGLQHTCTAKYINYIILVANIDILRPFPSHFTNVNMLLPWGDDVINMLFCGFLLIWWMSLVLRFTEYPM